MKKLFTKKLIGFISIATITAIIFSIISTAIVLAAPDFNVTNDMIDVTMNAGQTYTSKITITDQSATEPMDLQVEVDGLGQGLDGSSLALPASQDTSPYSARTFCSINKTSLHIDPGIAGDVNATVTVPAGKQSGEYYASIFLYTTSSDPNKVGVKLAILVPVIVTIPGFSPSRTAQIIGPAVPQLTAGQTIEADTTLKNNGNCRLSSATDTIALYNSSGIQISQSVITLGAPSILPGFSRQFTARFTAQPVGSYSVKSTIVLGDGTQLGPQTFSFNVIQPTTTPVSGSTPPIVTGFSPTSGSAGTTVTITGSGFTGSAVVGFGGVSAQSFSIDSDSQITAVVGNGASGTISVTNAGGTTYSTASFTFTAAPSITSFSPIFGSSGSSVTINGYNFTNITGVKFGGTSAQSYTVNSKYQITAVVGNGTSGAVSVSNANGTASKDGFVFIPLASTTSTTTTTKATTTTKTNIPTAKTTTVKPVKTITTTSVNPDTTDYLLPGIDPASLVVAGFDHIDLSYLDTTQQNGLEIRITGVDNAGIVILGRYINEPTVNVPFSAGQIKGGTGKNAIKYVNVRVKGTTTGTATITLHYSDQEVINFAPGSLFLAYYYGDKWHTCENMVINPNNHTISGDIPAIRLDGGIIGLGGDTGGNSANGFPVIGQNSSLPGQGISWALVGLIIGSIVILGVLIVAIISRKKNEDAET